MHNTHLSLSQVIRRCSQRKKKNTSWARLVSLWSCENVRMAWLSDYLGQDNVHRTCPCVFRGLRRTYILWRKICRGLDQDWEVLRSSISVNQHVECLWSGINVTSASFRKKDVSWFIVKEISTYRVFFLQDCVFIT